MRNWGQLLLMLGLASVLIIEAVGLTKDSESDFDPVSLRSFSVQSLDFKPMSRPPQLTARPLFRKTRRPPEIPVLDEVPPIEEIPQATPPAPQEIPELVPTFRHKLTAVTITGNESVAYMVNPVNLDLIRLEKGNQIDGWVLHEVHPDAVVLGYGTEQRVRLELWADEHDEDFFCTSKWKPGCARRF